MIRTTGQQIPVEGVKGNAGMGVPEHRAVWDCACSPERPSERKMNALIDDCSSGKWATSGGEELGHCFQRSAVMAFERKTEATFSILKTELYVKGWRRPVLPGGGVRAEENKPLFFAERLRPSCALSGRTMETPALAASASARPPAQQEKSLCCFLIWKKKKIYVQNWSS